MRARPLLTIGVFGLLLVGTAAVTVAQQTVSDGSLEDGQIGICHATGSEEQPFVYLVVSEDSAEHAGHGQHEGDKVGVDGPADCGITEPAGQPHEAQPASDDEMSSCHEDHENNTTDGPSPCDGDISVNKTGGADGEHITFDIVVDSLGPAEAAGAKLVDRLPDLGRPWNVSGADASSCWMEEREVRCDFGDIPKGEQRTISLKALLCPHDCGEDVTNKVIVHARNDANPENDRASVVVPIEDCPEEDWSWADEPTTSPSPSPSETPTSPPSNSTEPPASSTPPANTTEPNSTTPPAGNSSTSPEPNASTPAPAPKTSDARIRQRATQDHMGVTLTIEVASIGDAPVTSVKLQDTLPDIGRAWALSGADAEDCTLDGVYLNCAFGDLEPEASKVIEVRAFTDKMACGEHENNTAVITAADDELEGNNRATASVHARSC